MTQFLRNIVSSNGRGSALGLQTDSWRQVPRVNLLPQPAGPVTHRVFVGLVLVFLVEVIVIWALYSDLSSIRERIDDRGAPSQLQAQIDGIDADIQALYDRQNILQSEVGESQGALAELAEQHRVWGDALKAIFGAEIPGVRYKRVVSRPNGEVQVTGTADDEASIAKFQSNVRTLAHILELQGLQFGRGEESLDFTAAIRLK